MIRALLRLLIVAIIVIAGIAFFTGYRFSGGQVRGPAADNPTVGTSGIDTRRARERGAEVGEKVAQAGNRAAGVLSDTALTAKIKSKMALDDSVKALDIHVTTKNGDVTLTGNVHSESERERAVSLARETAGVRRVVDQLRVR